MRKILLQILTVFMLISPMPAHAEGFDHNHDHEHTQEVQETTNNQESQHENSDTFFTLDETSADVQEVVFYCDKEEHFHTEECFDTYKVLICENQEEDHIHNEDCFKEFSFLFCEKQEHIHDENCLDENYLEPEIIVDEEAEEARHAFEELLHKAINEEDNYYLNCEKTEHTHTADCFELFENLICEKEENLDKESEDYHKHSEECYDNYYVIVCEEKEEHTHTEDCISVKEEKPVIEEEIIKEEVPEENLDEEKADKDTPEVITQEYLDTLTEGVDYITSVPDDLPSDESIDEDTPLRSLSRAPLLLLGAGGIEIKSLVVQMFYGAKPQGGKYVWDANFNTSGHRFSYRINYETTGVFEIDEVGAVTFTIPKQILRDRDNNLSGTYEMSIPSKRDVDSGEELDRDVKFAYYEQGDNIIIYNFRKVSAGENGYIELSYLTNKPATSYKDMGKSDDFSVTMNINYNGTNESKYTHSVPVYINTNAKIKGVKKGPSGYPSRYSSWQTSWGTAEADADNYYYLLWTIRTEVTEPVTQPYNLKLVDTLKTGNGSIVGYKFSGQSTFTTNNIATNQTSDGYRYDYVLTKHPKSYWQPLMHWEITNSVTATVDPIDQIDADTSATSQQTYVWNKPVFTIPSGHFNSWKKADGWWRALDEEDLTYKNNIYKTPLSNLGHKNGEYSRYDLDEFQDGNLEYLNNLDWAVWMRGYPYPWTYQGSDPKNPDNYGKIPVKFELIDEGFYLWDEAVEQNKNLVLDHNDFQIDTITYEIRNSHVTGFDEENQKYIMSSNVFDNDDILNFYGKFEDGDWVKIATYKPLDSSIWFDSNYVESMTTSKITLKDNCIAYKVDTTNAHYYTEVNTVPNGRLKNSTKVMNFVQGKQSVGILNEQTANFYKNDGSLIVQTGEGDSNYLRVTQKDSYIFKDSVSATNNVKKKNYVITWKVGMTEQYIVGEGEINYINQESGVFYDLLPVGSNLDINSVSVRAGNSSRFSSAVDTAEKMKNRTGQFLPETAYTVEQIPNYKNTGRTLLIVRIKEEAKYYDIFFDTVHSWDSISDWGNDVYNPVAYETGNDKIKYGTNNDGGQISEKQLMANLPSEAQGEKFIYAEAEFDIATITAASTGLTKKVKALDDKDFSYDTITTNDGDYEYRWRIASSHTSKTKNIILFDSMENYVVEGKASDWHGTLESIDLSQVISMGVNPILYYSTIENLDIDENHDLTDSSVWQRLTDSTDLSSVKALALDARKKTNGQDFILEEGQSLTVILHMRAPHGAEAQGTYPETYNNIYLSDTVIGLNGQPQDFFIHQDYTTVRFVITEDLSLKKLSAEDESTPIKDIKFRLKGTSDYGTEEDRIVATDLKGEIVFKDIEKGSYILSEYEATVDWLLNPAEYVVTVDAEGVVSITGQDNSNFVSFDSNEGKYTLTLKDDPRVHGDVTLLKRREGDRADDIELKQLLANAEVDSEVEYNGKVYRVLEKTSSKVRIKEIPQGEAYAVYDSSTKTVTFFRDEVGKYTHNQVDGTKTYYTGIETAEYFANMDVPPWQSSYSLDVYITYIFEDIISPIDTSHWFCLSADVKNLNLLDTSNVTNMSLMFYNSQMASLDLSSFDTSKVTDMSSMFHVSQATFLDLSSFDTSNVTYMYDMFLGSHTTSLDLSSFDTSKVTNMDRMFRNATSLANIYVSDKWSVFNVSSSTDMFTGSTNLPNYNSSYVDKTRAHYNEDGYLTYKSYAKPSSQPSSDQSTNLKAGEQWISIETKPQTPISDTTFKLSGTSDYGTETTKLETTNTAGRVTFTDIELGTYTLEEIVPNSDYVLNTTKWTVKIDENGNASIIEPEDENLRDRLYTVEKVGNNYVVFNEPRYWNFTLRKIDKENETIWIHGAEFTLSGISDLGTEYNEVVESNENGRVIFNRIEKGTYILKETKAPTGVTETGAQGGNRNYIADSRDYIVKIDNQGNVTIDGLTMNQYDDYVMKNDRAYDGKITIVKKWEDNLTNDERPEPVVHLSTNEPNWKRGITVTKVWEGDSAEDRPEDIKVHLGEKNKILFTTNFLKNPQKFNGTNFYTFIDELKLKYNDDLVGPDIDGLYTLDLHDKNIYAVIRDGENNILQEDKMTVLECIEDICGLRNDDESRWFYAYSKSIPDIEWHNSLSSNDEYSSFVQNGGSLSFEYRPQVFTSTLNGWTKNPDNTWTYTFDILLEDENADKEFYVWEEPVEGYTTENGESNPVLAENQAATITNTRPWSAKYAVSLMGIGVDENQNGEKMGLTFGPATGDDVNKIWTKEGASDPGYVNAYKSHIPTGITDNGNARRCLHDDDWETIIYWNNTDPYVYEQCINESCTHSVELHQAGETILNQQFKGVSTGDGPSILFRELIQYSGTTQVYENLSWHPNNNMPNDDDTRGTNYGGWGASRIRAMLNGADSLTDLGDGTAAKDGGTDIYASYSSSDIHKSASIYTSTNNLLVTFPQELQDAIGKRATKYDSVYNSKTEANLKISYDKLWLLSPNEIWSTSQNTTSNYKHPLEGVQYERFVSGNSTVTSSRNSSQNTFNKAVRFTLDTDAVGSAYGWWLRSSDSYYTSNVTYVYSLGAISSVSASDDFGISPCFSLDTDYKFFTTKYAVQIYGIGQDTLKDGSTAGLTFGPALGENFTRLYISHTPSGSTDGSKATDNQSHDHRCIHNDDWDTIIYWNKLDPAVYEQCIAENCTHSVKLTLSDTLKNPNFVYRGTDIGDGTGMLYTELYDFNNTTQKYQNLSWNPINNSNSGRDVGTNKDGWGASRVRAMMNGYDELTATKGSYSYPSFMPNIDPVESYTGTNTLIASFPKILQDNIGARKTLYDSVYNRKTTSNLRISYDKLWLLSTYEIANSISDTYYQHPLEAPNGKYQKFVENDIDLSISANSKYVAYRWGTWDNWWLRSNFSAYNDCVTWVRYDGGVNFADGYNYAGITPCFSLKR